MNWNKFEDVFDDAAAASAASRNDDIYTSASELPFDERSSNPSVSPGSGSAHSTPGTTKKKFETLSDFSTSVWKSPSAQTMSDPLPDSPVSVPNKLLDNNSSNIAALPMESVGKKDPSNMNQPVNLLSTTSVSGSEETVIENPKMKSSLGGFNSNTSLPRPFPVPGTSELPLKPTSNSALHGATELSTNRNSVLDNPTAVVAFNEAFDAENLRPKSVLANLSFPTPLAQVAKRGVPSNIPTVSPPTVHEQVGRVVAPQEDEENASTMKQQLQRTSKAYPTTSENVSRNLVGILKRPSNLLDSAAAAAASGDEGSVPNKFEKNHEAFSPSSPIAGGSESAAPSTVTSLLSDLSPTLDVTDVGKSFLPKSLQDKLPQSSTTDKPATEESSLFGGISKSVQDKLPTKLNPLNDDAESGLFSPRNFIKNPTFKFTSENAEKITAFSQKSQFAKIGQAAEVEAQLQSIPKGAILPLSLAVALFLAVFTLVWFFYFLEYGAIISGAVAGGVLIILSIAFLASSQMRVAGFISFPTMSTTIGQVALLTLAFTLLLFGPVANIARNADDVTNTVICASGVALNQTQSIRDLMRTPFNAIEDNLEAAMDKWKEISGKLKNKLKFMEDMLLKMVDVTDGIQKKVNNIEQSCEKAFDGVRDQCSGKLGSVAEQCEQKLGEADKWMDKLKDGVSVDSITDKFKDIFGKKRRRRRKRGVLDGVCKALRLDSVCSGIFRGDLCGPLKMTPVIGELDIASDKLKEGVSWMDEFFNFDLRSLKNDTTPLDKVGNSSESIFMKATNIQKQLNTFFLVVRIIGIMASFTFVAVLVYSYVYVGKWLIGNDYDNRIILRDDVDAAVQPGVDTNQGRVLPLRPIEKEEYVDGTSTTLSPLEKKGITTGLILLVVNIILAAVLLTVDHLLRFVMNILVKHGDIQIDFGGDEAMAFEVVGGGLMAEFLHVFIDGFKSAAGMNMSLGFNKCLPHPQQMNIKYYIGLGLIYLSVLLLIIFQGHCLRFRQTLLGFFYPERLRQRLLYLWSRIRKGRHRSVESVRLTALNIRDENERRRLIKQKKKTNNSKNKSEGGKRGMDSPDQSLLLLNGHSRKVLCCSCRLILDLARMDGSSIHCPNQQECHAVYCEFCWSENGQKCILCQ